MRGRATAAIACCVLAAACAGPDGGPGSTDAREAAIEAPAATDTAGGAVTDPSAEASERGVEPGSRPEDDPRDQTSAEAPVDDPQEYAVPDPGPLDESLLTADVLITSTKPIAPASRRKVAHLKGVAGTLPMSVASLSSNGRTLTIAAVDPAEFRRYTPVQTARADQVWKRVAGGEVAVDPSVGHKLEEPKGYLKLGTQDDAPSAHIGAYAPLVKDVSAVMTPPRGEELGMPPNNALLVSTGRLTPSVLTGKMQRILGKSVSLRVLALEFDLDVPQTAVLTGTTAADAVGSFSYKPLADGRVVPDPAWVSANIRTERVPLLGAVTCHRVMIPQLRAALQEVVQRGLASKIHPDEYAGCYYPRYIGYDPAKGLSLHSWGIAVDLNVPGNQRGTVGEMDRQVVAIFKKWGFAWGGDWNYTDPMHFELASIVKAG